ncbi:MAG: stage III sporulation protein AB [Syntrophomonadaceae bacterium]|jgi:stage III sporulation protein AB|nr:stage III sporulation protein AB [Syntrophomonadaceae bacterium]
MLWIKIMGSVMLVSALGFWGLAGAHGIGRRSEELKELRFALAFLEKEITYMHTPLTLALERTAAVCHHPIAGFFLESAVKLKAREGLTAGEAWGQGIAWLKTQSHLKSADLEVLNTAAQQLGMSDSSDQRKFLMMIQEEIKVQEEKARQEQRANQKLWSYGGFIMGIVIVLLLI